jgi:hypothetical protein
MTDSAALGVQKDKDRSGPCHRPGHEEFWSGQFHGPGAMVWVATVEP